MRTMAWGRRGRFGGTHGKWLGVGAPCSPPRSTRPAIKCPGAHRPALHAAALWLCAACRMPADKLLALTALMLVLYGLSACLDLARLSVFASCARSIDRGLSARIVASGAPRPEPRPRPDPRFLQRPGAGGAVRPAVDAALSRLDVCAPCPARAAGDRRRGIAHRMRLLRRAEHTISSIGRRPRCGPCGRRCSPRCSVSAPISP